MIGTVLVGESPPVHALRDVIARVAPTRLPVLIEGATGTGKELVAALLHQHSTRAGSFVPFNVCAIGESMFEDALFGHVRGAYTGAATESLGFLREANGGTAFFDEISGLPLGLQAKLLRAIETGVFRPIGATRDARSDFRVVAATNERLAGLVERGSFRADLRHRLSGIVLAVPSLADRIDDIPHLARHFARQPGFHAAARAIDEPAMRLLMDLPWPGNIRELKQVVESAAVFAKAAIDVDAIRRALAHRSSGDGDGDINVHDDPRGRGDLVDALRDASWDVERAAIRLGMHRATLYRRMKRLGIGAPRFSNRNDQSAYRSTD
jgi:DNA-binding NtrC family response regulator